MKTTTVATVHLARNGKWRWRCRWCTSFGFNADPDVATVELEQHYWTNHAKETR